MYHRSLIVPALALALLGAPALRAQEPSRLGLNLSISTAAQVGVTCRLTSRLYLRPGVVLDWTRFAPDSATSASELTYGLALDALLALGSSDAVRPYTGVGGRYALMSGNNPSGTGHQVGGVGFFGVRVRVVSRVQVYGEAALRYASSRTPGGLRVEELTLQTMPLGVLVYLK